MAISMQFLYYFIVSNVYRRTGADRIRRIKLADLGDHAMRSSYMGSAAILLAAFVLLGSGYKNPGNTAAPEETAGKSYNNNKNKNKNDYKAGSGEAVKSWKEASLDDAKKSQKPICVYLYDGTNKRNDRAKLMEGAEGLDSAEVKDKLKEFFCVKFDIGINPKDTTKEKDMKGWPTDWPARAKDGAAVMFISSDTLQLLAVDRDTPKDSIIPSLFLNDIQTILKYEEAKKAQAAKQTKEQPKVAEAKK